MYMQGGAVSTHARTSAYTRRQAHNGGWYLAHDTAVIHEEALIGEGVKIGRLTVIGEQTVIGEMVRIGAGVRIGEHSEIGAWVRIGERARIGGRSVLGRWTELGRRAVVGEYGRGYVHCLLLGYYADAYRTADDRLWLRYGYETRPVTEWRAQLAELCHRYEPQRAAEYERAIRGLLDCVESLVL